jgi:hypothetical protein
MPLILLHVGKETSRFSSLTDAKRVGEKAHSSENPAIIEVTPDGGGPISTIKFEPKLSDWLS